MRLGPVRKNPVNALYRSIVCATAVLVGLTAVPVRAQALGRLKFSVKNAADEKPVAAARITLKDSAAVRPTINLTTDAQGEALTGPMDVRAWRVTTEAETFTADTRDVTVVADATTDVEVLLEPLTEKVIKITTRKELVDTAQVGAVTQRDVNGFKRFPTNAGNPQSLPDLLRSVPGVAGNSVNQIHPRGEHSSTAILIDGFYLPGALQGRAGQVLTPSAIGRLNVLTGSFAPEYGGETAAILDIKLRAGAPNPQREFFFQGGNFNTWFGNLNVGGQAGRSGPAENAARRFSYFVDVTGRRTDNALEAPQPDNQTAHNGGTSQSFFGNFGYKPSAKDDLGLVLNFTPAYTQIANRTGLPASFAGAGQGFGFGGELSRAAARGLGILNQERAGQDINQRDSNSFGVLSWNRTVSSRLSTNFSLGAVLSDLDIRNNNPAVNPLALPGDSSIEYNPTILRSYRHIQPQVSATYTSGKHTFKSGILYNHQSGDESYNLESASQLALNAIAAADPRLAPGGTFQVDGGGAPILDRRGNQVYLIDPANAATPTLRVRRTGYYAAGYLQDTWTVSPTFTVNYGARADFYSQSQNLGQADVSSGALSPRVNLSYSLNPKTVARASYNRLFVQPPLAQGSILGQAVKPQTGDQYDLSIERELAPRHLAKIGYYFKNLKNVLDTGLLLEGTQIGAYSTVSLDAALIRGFELSYEMLPENGKGWSSYFTATFSRAEPRGFTNTGDPVAPFTDHDQRSTLNFGVNYTLKSGATAGLNLYHGSGVASSVVGTSGRTPRSILNLTLATGPRFFGKHGVGVQLAIENLTDDRSVINFASPFSGTRFQQGRRFLLSVTGKF